jgi:hypothetical protein
MKIVHGVSKVLTGKMYAYVGLYENRPKLDRLIKGAGTSVQGIKTSPVEIRATTNLYDVELKFPFLSCKKAK